MSPIREKEIFLKTDDKNNQINTNLDVMLINENEKPAKINTGLVKLRNLVNLNFNTNCSKLGVKNQMIQKSPTAERNLKRKDSEKSLPDSEFILNVPQDVNIENPDTVKFPSYILSIVTSEPQDCNPAQSFFLKSGVHSRSNSSSKQPQVKKSAKKKEPAEESEIEKLITEKMKKVEDFDSIFKDFDIKSIKK